MSWLVTREINEYNQNGEYFVAMFREKPTLEKFARAVPSYHGKDNIEWWYEGNGRYGNQYEWYWLREYSLQ